jgi:hypothetical protein
MRPGVEVISRAQPLPRSALTDVGAAFMVGSTGSGAGTVATVRSLTDYENAFGARGSAPSVIAAYDSADAFFREGGASLTVSSLAGGTVDATVVQAALDALTKDYGPGQVFIAESDVIATDPNNQTALLDHAASHNRIALLHQVDDADAAALITGMDDVDRANGRYGAMFAPWAVLPGVASGTTRKIGYDAIVAGIIARNDPVLNPNVPSAGVNGQAVYATSVSNRYTDGEYEDLNDAGCNMARLIYAGVRTYGWRTLIDPAGDQSWLNLGNARLNMAITAQAEAIGESYVFTQLDGRRLTISQFGGELRAMLAKFWTQGALYGATAEDAFYVDVGSTVNTEETIANGELHAVLEVRMSPFAERVVIEIVKVATTQAIAA